MNSKTQLYMKMVHKSISLNYTSILIPRSYILVPNCFSSWVPKRKMKPKMSKIKLLPLFPFLPLPRKSLAAFSIPKLSERNHQPTKPIKPKPSILL